MAEVHVLIADTALLHRKGTGNQETVKIIAPGDVETILQIYQDPGKPPTDPLIVASINNDSSPGDDDLVPSVILAVGADGVVRILKGQQ